MDCDGYMFEDEHFSKSYRGGFRERSIQKSRAGYGRSQAEWHVAIPRHRYTMPHRAARVARRTRLALSAMEGPPDMPTISMGSIGCRKECRKPAVSQFLYQPQQLTSLHELELEYSENSDEQSGCESTPTVSLGWTATFLQHPSRKLRPLKRRLDKPVHLLAGEFPELTNAETTAGESTTAESSDTADSADDASHSQTHIRAEVVTNPCPGTGPSQCGVKDSTHGEHSAKREVIFRDIILRLRAQALKAEQAATRADARAHDAETRANTSETALSKVVTSQALHHKKNILQAERQRALELRKKRNQAMHIHGVKQKAELALYEATAIRERAEVKAMEIQTRAMAEAQIAAYSQNQTLVDDHAFLLEAEAEELKTKRLLEASEIEAKAQATLFHAESSAREIRLRASEEAAAQVEALVMSARSRAEQDAQVIKAQALEHALALKVKVDEQARAKLAAANDAQTIAEEAATAAAGLVSEQENRAKHDAYVETIKRAKALEQNRARKHQRQAAHHRNEATRLQSSREKIAATLREADAIKVKAEIDVAELHSRAVAEAQTAAAAQSRAVVDIHLAMAQGEVEELKNQSLREAMDMKEETKAQVQATLSQAEISAKEIKVKASAEAAAQAEALVQAAMSRAEHEAQTIKAAAMEHAQAFKAKAEEQAQAKLEAAKDAQAIAEAAAQAAVSARASMLVVQQTSEQVTLTLKQAKQLEQQRSKKHQRQVVQVRQKQELKEHAMAEARLQAAEERGRIMEQAMQDAASLKAQARSEAQAIKSKARALLKARVHERSPTLTRCVHLQPETKCVEIGSVPEQANAGTVVQPAETAFVPHVAPSVHGANDSEDLLPVEMCADVRVADVQMETEWEVLPDLSVEQCYETSWNLVST